MEIAGVKKGEYGVMEIQCVLVARSKFDAMVQLQEIVFQCRKIGRDCFCVIALY
jgi:hypothetical protein